MSLLPLHVVRGDALSPQCTRDLGHHGGRRQGKDKWAKTWQPDWQDTRDAQEAGEKLT